MGTGNFHLNLPFHLPHHHNHGGKRELKDIPRGCLAIMVGQGKEQQRFIVPVNYINHPLFVQLLKKAEKEYEFEYHKGPISIPCHVAEFRQVQGLIDKEWDHHHHHHHNNHHSLTCFRV